MSQRREEKLPLRLVKEHSTIAVWNSSVIKFGQNCDNQHYQTASDVFLCHSWDLDSAGKSRMLPAPSASCLFPSFGGNMFQKNDPHKPQRSISEKSGCAIRGKRKQLFTREVKCLRKIQKMLDLDSGYPVLWGVPCNGLQVLWADHSQHLRVKMLHFIQLIKVPEGAVKPVKQKEMHINSLHWIGKRELCPFHPPSSSVFYTVREKKMRE